MVLWWVYSGYVFPGVVKPETRLIIWPWSSWSIAIPITSPTHPQTTTTTKTKRISTNPVWHWNAPWELRERKGSFAGHNWLLWTNGLRGSSENWSFTKMCVLTWTSFCSYGCLATGTRKCVSSWRMRARRFSTTSGRDKNRSSSAFFDEIAALPYWEFPYRGCGTERKGRSTN